MACWDSLTESFGGSLMSNLLRGAATVVVAPADECQGRLARLRVCPYY